MIARRANCTDIAESGLIPVEQALNQILAATVAISGDQIIPIERAKGRTLAAAISAPFAVPYQHNSAVDGYAFCTADIPATGTAQLAVVGTCRAGEANLAPIKLGQCVRIMTGAIIPQGLDVVAMQEQVELHNGVLTIDGQHRAGQNIRLAGEDIQPHETILQPGRFITAADIGLIASLGIAEIKVRRKLKIAIASTGNELLNIGAAHSKQKIYDSNRYILAAILDRPDLEIINLGILQDQLEVLLEQFEQSSLYADIIISSGGVSVGDADYTRLALSQAGTVDCWKIAIKPGRPLAFGKINQCLFFGLPGNPVAVMVTFYQFVLPAIEQMLGIKNKITAPKIAARSTENIRKKPGRTEVIRGIMHQDSAGSWWVNTTGKQGSGILRSMSLANSFIILEHDRGPVKAGETVIVQSFAGL